MPNWKVENLRVTGFTLSEPTESAEDLWTGVVGAPPERIDQRVKEGVVNIVGPFEGVALTLSHTRLRTDWICVPESESGTAPNGLFPMGDFEMLHKTFVPLAKKWLSRNPLIVRLAWAGVLLLPVASKEDGYRSLAGFLSKLEIDPVGSADLSYQINRPRASRVVDGLRINRLSTWSVAFLQPMSMQFTLSSGAAEAVAAATGPSLSACRLQFDVNTDPARKEPFRSETLVPLLEELEKLSAEIITHGDVP